MTPDGVCKALKLLADFVNIQPSQRFDGVLDLRPLQDYIDGNAPNTRASADNSQSRQIVSSSLAQAYCGYQQVKMKQPNTKGTGSLKTGKYRCPFDCDYKFEDKHSFIRHQLLHFPAVIWVCPHTACSSVPSVFFRDYFLRRHYKKHNDDCGGIMSKERSKECSIPVLDSQFPRECAFHNCTKTFQSIKARASHIADHYEHNEIGELRDTRLSTNTEDFHSIAQVGVDTGIQLDEDSTTSSTTSEDELESFWSRDFNHSDDPGPSGSGGGHAEHTQGYTGFSSNYQSSESWGGSTSDGTYGAGPQYSFNQSFSLDLKDGALSPARSSKLHNDRVPSEEPVSVLNNDRLLMVTMFSRACKFWSSNPRRTIFTNPYGIYSNSSMMKRMVRGIRTAVSKGSGDDPEKGAIREKSITQYTPPQKSEPNGNPKFALHSVREPRAVATLMGKAFNESPTASRPAQRTRLYKTPLSEEVDHQQIPDLTNSSDSETSEEEHTLLAPLLSLPKRTSQFQPNAIKVTHFQVTGSSCLEVRTKEF